MAKGYSSGDVYAYIAKYKDLALQNEREYGIPAPITLAQGIVESGAGTSTLTRSSNNHFCIKAGSGWSGNVYLAWDDEAQKSRFRCYSSAEESFRDHARLLSSSNYYRNLFNINVFDYRGWAHGLKKAGYATAPNYAQALIGIIDQYKLYEVNGGAKLKPGKTVIIKKYVEVTKEVSRPVFEEDCIIPEEVVTEEQQIVEEVEEKRLYAVNINNIHCTVIQPGEDLASISRQYDISLSDLVKYNDVASQYQLKEGDIVFLDKKKKKYEGAQDVYIAKADDTLHGISQKFGVQLDRLAKMNGMNRTTPVKEGSKIMLK